MENASDGITNPQSRRGSNMSNIDLILSNLTSISRVMKNLSIRFPQDDAADEYMNSQFKYSLDGGKNHSYAKSNRGLNLHESVEEDYHKAQLDASELKEGLTNDYLPRESHLSIISATEVGCHHPEISFSGNLSVISLHNSESICNTCTSHFKIDFLKGDFNPFRCWRRGNRAGRFGFVYRASLRTHGDKWTLQKTPDMNRISSSNLVLASLRYYLSANKTGLRNVKYIKFKKIDHRLANTMMVVLKISSHVIVENDEVDELKHLLPSQLMVSSHVDMLGKGSKKINFVKLPELLSEIAKGVNGKWTNNSMSNQSNGILSICIIHNKQEDLVKHIEPVLRQTNIVNDSNFSIVESHNISSNVLEEIDGNLAKKEGVSICLILDPIMDIGGDYN